MAPTTNDESGGAPDQLAQTSSLTKVAKSTSDGNKVTKSSSLKKAGKDDKGQPDVTTRRELIGWYVYDWANSPMWQVADVATKWLMKRMAERGSSFPSDLLSPGSYPAAILWINSAFQVVTLLSFGTFGDFGLRRKRLMQVLTFTASGIYVLTLLCFTGSLWWLAGVLRVAAGCCFVLCLTYYDAYLPLLTGSHEKVIAAEQKDVAVRENQVSDEISATGFAFGFAGGMSMQIISALVLMFMECDHDDPNCSDFDRLFPLCTCIALVGVWWSGFSLISFWGLRTRPGPPFPQGVPAVCFGWKRAWQTMKAIYKLHQTRIYVLGYFLWSDALSTTQNVAALLLDDEEQNDSAKMMALVLASAAACAGVFILFKVQQLLGTSNKRMLLAEMLVLAAVCIVGFFTKLDGIFYYICGGTLALLMGSLQAYSRSLYAQLSPTGMEAAMFSFYTITDKGSSLLGAAVIAGVHTTTGSYRGVLWYCFFAFVVSVAILASIDVNEGQRQAGRAEAAPRKSHEVPEPKAVGKETSDGKEGVKVPDVAIAVA